METDEKTNAQQHDGGAVSMSPSTSLFDSDRFHAIALDVEFDYGMGGLCGTVYEEFAKDICIRYLSNDKMRVDG